MPGHHSLNSDQEAQDRLLEPNSIQENINLKMDKKEHHHYIFSTQPRLALNCILVHQDWLIGGSDHHSGFLFAWPLHSSSQDQQQKPIVLHHYHQKSIQALHSIGPYWFSSSKDGTLRQWNIDLECTGIIHETDPSQSFITCMASLPHISSDEELTPLFTGGADGTITKWIWTDRDQVQKSDLTFQVQEPKGWITCLIATETQNDTELENIVIAGYSDHVIRLWDDKTGDCNRTLEGHQDAVCSLVVHKKTNLISGSRDGKIMIWDLKSLNPLKRFQASQDPIRSLIVVPAGHFDFLISMGDDKLVQIWDLLSLKNLKTLTGHFGGIRSGLLSQAKQALFTGSRDGTVRKWAISTQSHQSATLTAQAAQWLHSENRGNFDIYIIVFQ
jgi:WD40 repeat protein